jgi:hypothetical protein
MTKWRGNAFAVAGRSRQSSKKPKQAANAGLALIYAWRFIE